MTGNLYDDLAELVGADREHVKARFYHLMYWRPPGDDEDPRMKIIDEFIRQIPRVPDPVQAWHQALDEAGLDIVEFVWSDDTSEPAAATLLDRATSVTLYTRRYGAYMYWHVVESDGDVRRSDSVLVPIGAHSKGVITEILAAATGRDPFPEARLRTLAKRPTFATKF